VAAWRSGPPDDCVVDEPGLADAGGDGDEDLAVERLRRRKGLGVDEREVLGLDAELTHGRDAGRPRGGEVAAVAGGVRGGVEAALEGERAAALVASQADVAARQREAAG